MYKNKKPFFIAEAGVNHENNLNLAEQIICEAKKGGADSVKFQTYKAETIASKKSPAYWDTTKIKINSQFKLFKKYDHFNKIDYIKLKKICDHNKIDFMSTPFDHESALMLNKLVKHFKIASADLTNYPLIQTVCSFNKPIIISTGASNFREISATVKFIKKINPKIKIILLHCILSYPTQYKDCNLNYIPILKSKFKSCLVGLSDHTMPDENLIVLTKAYELGASVIEKHFTTKKMKGKKGNDHFHSICYEDIKKLKDNIKIINSISGSMTTRKVLTCEKNSRKFARRSLYTCGFIKKGEFFSSDNIIPKRPGTGISPIDMKKIIGKKAKLNLSDDTQIKWSHLK
tara:strand:+ start:1538 stop:2575 length:1038 start_codon:yes stop_codon:yes gene_type:complete